MVSAPARAKLRPCSILQRCRDRRHLPVLVHDVVLAPRLERGAHAEPCFTLERFGEPRLVDRERTDGQIENGHLHPAGDIHADGVRNDRVVGREHATDRQAIPDVRIGHERAGSGNRQPAGVFHLLDGVGFQAFTPDTVRRRSGARKEAIASRVVLDDQPRQLTVGVVREEVRRRRRHPLQIREHAGDAAFGRLRHLEEPLRGTCRRTPNPHPLQISGLHVVCSSMAVPIAIR